MLKGFDEFHSARLRLKKEDSALLEKHPRKWVAVGKDEVLALGHSMEEMFDSLETDGSRKAEYVTEYLDPDPPILIL